VGFSLAFFTQSHISILLPIRVFNLEIDMSSIKDWELYMNPKRNEVDGPWLWGLCVQDQMTISAVPRNGRTGGPSSLLDPCVIHQNVNGHFQDILDDKIKKGYLPIGDFGGTDELIVAIASWFQVVAEALYLGTDLDFATQVSVWEDICSTQFIPEPGTWPLGSSVILSTPSRDAPLFEFVCKSFTGRLLAQGKRIIDITDEDLKMVLRGGSIAPIW
jgi:hypothetical protein